MSVPVAYLTVVLIWSTTPLAIQWSSAGAGFAFAVLARMAIGVTLTALILAVGRRGFPLHRKARQTYLAGGLGLFGAMSLTYWGSQFIDSGLIAVLFGLSPLTTGLMAALWLGERALTPTKLAGMALGVAGLAVIFGADLMPRGGPAGGPGVERAAIGMTALVLAVSIYSATLVWIKRIGDDSPPLAITAGTLAVSLPLFALVWALAGGQVPADLPGRSWAAIVYLGVFGSVVGFALYYYVIKHLEAGRVALITLMTPLLALLLGALLNGETPPPGVWAGTACIVLGLSLHQWETLVGVAWRREK